MSGGTFNGMCDHQLTKDAINVCCLNAGGSSGSGGGGDGGGGRRSLGVQTTNVNSSVRMVTHPIEGATKHLALCPAHTLRPGRASK